MHDLEHNLPGLLALLLRINLSRVEARDEALEALVELQFQPSRRLAVYGTLAPGEVNADQLSSLAGTWSPAVLRGERSANGWGLTWGYPGFRWDEAGTDVPALLFESDELPVHWGRLDQFEGLDYRRILVPMYRPAGSVVVANVYGVAFKVRGSRTAHP
ncbi:MAG: gamma-glutamylcyclotransferase family protein [Rhodothermales bacterium]|nr:gamma-glutamylcyclotransferase family protein [Rhodothermales bacterium]